MEQRNPVAGCLSSILKIVIVLIVVLVLVGMFDIFSKPEFGPVKTSEKAAKDFEFKVAKMKFVARRGGNPSVKFTEEEINSYIAFGHIGQPLIKDMREYCRDNIGLETLVVRLRDNRMQVFMQIVIKGSPVYVSLRGKLRVVNGQVRFIPVELKIGQLPVPPKFVDLVVNHLKKGKKPLRAEMRPYVEDIGIEGNSLAVEAKAVGSFVSGGEGSPHEAQIWLEMANEYYHNESYLCAFNGYQMVREDYRNSKYAQEAERAIYVIETNDEALVSLLRSNALEIRAYAISKLGYMKSRKAVPFLIESLADADSIRLVAMRALAKIGDEKATLPLLGILKKEAEADSIWTEAIRTLGKIKDKRAVEPLINMLENGPHRFADTTARALRELGDRKAVDPLERALKKYRGEKRLVLALRGSLYKLGEEKDKQLSLIIKVLSDEDWDIRAKAARELGLLGDRRAIPALRKALTDPFSLPTPDGPYYLVREAAAKALKQIQKH